MSCLVLDTGKTHTKIAVVTENGDIEAIEVTATPTIDTEFYKAIDVERIFNWFINQCQQLSKKFSIDRIIPVTHGATAVLIDDKGQLALPVLDYEHDIPLDIFQQYDEVRPDFETSLSPSLPIGLNLGRQIYFQSQAFPEAFSKAKHILMYPQYWAWKLCSELCTEISSLGCHTDLWNVRDVAYSSLIESQNWQDRFPSIDNAWEQISIIHPELAKSLSLPESCAVHVGVHDSNAALFPYAAQALSQKSDFALLSTGTWFIAMAPGSDISNLKKERDCLAMIDVFGRPIACSRFMGGREYESLLDGRDRVDVTERDIVNVLVNQEYALPNFVEAGGPFPNCKGLIFPEKQRDDNELNALATVYIAMVANVCLNLSGAKGELIIEGPLTNNAMFCRLIAALRPDSDVYISKQAYGVTQGAAALSYWPDIQSQNTSKEKVLPLSSSHVESYKRFWAEKCKQHNQISTR